MIYVIPLYLQIYHICAPTSLHPGHPAHWSKMCLGFTNLFPTCSFAEDLRDPTSKDTGLKLVEEKMKAGRDALPVAILACGGDAWKANMATF